MIKKGSIISLPLIPNRIYDYINYNEKEQLECFEHDQLDLL